MPTMNTPKIVARVTNDAERSFNVVLVCRGDRYGLNDKLTHDKDESLVEFWDATYENDPRFTKGRGQFATRYYLSTLKAVFLAGAGLDLCGHEPAWKVTSRNVADAIAAVKETLGCDDPAKVAREESERSMFGCTTAAIDEALAGKSPRDVAMYAMGTLSNAQELIRRDEYEGTVEWSVSDSNADTIRQFINVAKYAIDKAVPR